LDLRGFLQRHLTSDWNNGYIVMQYINAPDCGEGDHQLVARAVQTLISVKGLSSAPGPVSRGCVIHNDWTSPITYKTWMSLSSILMA